MTNEKENGQVPPQREFREALMHTWFTRKSSIRSLALEQNFVKKRCFEVLAEKRVRYYPGRA